MKTRLCFYLIALAMMVGCATRPPAVDFEKDFLQEKAKYEPNIGKTYWLLGIRSLCPTPTTNIIDCASIPEGTKLHTDGVERGVTTDAYYHVTLDDGRTGYIEAFGLLRFATDVDPAQAAADCKARGEPRIGMSRKQVEQTCWGKPIRVDRRETARGVTERYVYSKTRFVLLHNGIVTSVQISGTLR
ncbi:MAG: hypothetical protein ACTHJS_02050 [Xanthobacteraceae bacterium]